MVVWHGPHSIVVVVIVSRWHLPCTFRHRHLRHGGGDAGHGLVMVLAVVVVVVGMVAVLGVTMVDVIVVAVLGVAVVVVVTKAIVVVVAILRSW